MNSKTPNFVNDYVDLLQPRLGTTIHSCSDEFFAACERMLQPQSAVFIEGKYDENGKWMDGWETRRRRQGGNDWAIISLGHRGVVKGVDIDTSHFIGNFPPAASLQATHATEINDATEWFTLIEPTQLNKDQHHYFDVCNDSLVTHLRLNIFPDGGIARLRVYGQIHCDWANKDKSKVYELSSIIHGAKAIAWNDAHFGAVDNMLAPNSGANMGDGWETRRRREPGNDWCIIQLGHVGIIEKIMVDTAFFKGNYPDRCSIQAAYVENATQLALITQSMFWQELLPEQALSMDQQHHFDKQIQALGGITHIRFNIIPDGGVSRLRLYGKII